MAGIEDSYIVHCAQTLCSMGIRPSCVVLEKSHGVFLKECAQLTIKDIKVNQNILDFGGCVSPENPDTIAEAEKICANVEAQTQVPLGGDAVGIFSFEGQEDGVKRMGCCGKCTPVIVSPEWEGEKEDVYADKREKALYGKATLTCKYGGLITIETTGQPEE